MAIIKEIQDVFKKIVSAEVAPVEHTLGNIGSQLTKRGADIAAVDAKVDKYEAQRKADKAATDKTLANIGSQLTSRAKENAALAEQNAALAEQNGRILALLEAIAAPDVPPTDPQG